METQRNSSLSTMTPSTDQNLNNIDLPKLRDDWSSNGQVTREKSSQTKIACKKKQSSSPLAGKKTSSADEKQTSSSSSSSSLKNNQTFTGQLLSSHNIRPSLQEELAALRSFKIPNKRTELTLQEKVDLLNHSEGKSQRQLAQMFQIGKSQVQTILKRRTDILKAYEHNCVSDRKRFGKRAENDDVNKFTWVWFQEMSKTRGVQVNGPMLQERAKQFAKQLGRHEFKASNGWLASFRKRHNILSSEQGLSTREPAKISSWKDNLKKTMSDYSYGDVFCLTEIHLNYSSLPDKVKSAFSKRKGENSEHCMTVMLWYNMLGDFDTPIVIGQQAWQAECGVEEADMPVIWRWNTNAWVSSEIFQEWARALDRKFQQQGRRVLLFLEHTSVHFIDFHLEHVKFLFHPSNSLEAVPFNNDVTQRFKFCYLKQLLQFVTSQLSSHQENVLAIANCVSVLESCLWINQAVGQIYPSVVKKAFCRSLEGFVSLSDLEVSEDSVSSENETESVDEELEFNTLVGIVLSSLHSSSHTGPSQGNEEHFGSNGDVKSEVTGNCDSKVRRVELTLQEKVELLRIHHHKGKTQRQLAKMFGIGKSQAHSILKRKDEILDHYENSANLARKRICRRAENDEVNRLTLEWYTEVSKLADIPITGPMVQEKAKRIASELGRTDFKASNGWLDSFRKRNNIVFFFSKSANNSVLEENLEEVSVSFPSSVSCDNSFYESRQQNSDSSRNLHPDISELQLKVKTEPFDFPDQSSLSQSSGHLNKETTPSDSDDEGDDDDSDSESVKSKAELGETNRTSSKPTQFVSKSRTSEKRECVDKHLSPSEISSIQTFDKAAAVARDLRLFCEDKNLTQLSVMLDFIEKQLKIRHTEAR